MADIKISQLPVVTTVATTDIAPVVASGATSRITIENLANSLPTVPSASYAVTASYALNAAGTTSSPTNQIATGSVTASVNIGTASFQLTSGSSTFLFVSSSGNTVISGSPSDLNGTLLTVKSNVNYVGINLVATDRNAIINTNTRAIGVQVVGLDVSRNSNNAIYNSAVVRFLNGNSTTTYGYVGQLSTTQFGVTATASDLHLQTDQTSSLYIASASGFVAVGRNYLTASTTLDVSGSGRFTGNVTASRAFISSSNGTASGSTLILYGSGSAQPVFTVQGSQGELFSVNDALSGSLFSVNDISGLPVIEAFSDNRVLIGSYQSPVLFTTVRVTSTAGANVIYSVPTGSYDALFFEYSLKSGSNARAGQIMSIWSGSDTNWTETVTADFGNTTGVTFRTIITGSSLALTGSFPSASWIMKTIVRAI